MRANKLWPLLLVAVLIALGGFVAIRTIVNSGPSAIAAMDPKERVLAAKLDALRRGMTHDEVFQVLGPPDDPGPLGLRPKWQVGNNPFSAVVVYFTPEGARKVRWLSVGRFMYERNL